MKKIKFVVYEMFYNYTEKKWYYLIDNYFLSILIFLNIFAVFLSTFQSLREPYWDIFWKFEVVSVIIFSIEYLLRLWVSDIKYKAGPYRSRVKYFFSFYGFVDLLAIIPFYLPLFLALDLRFLRILRLLRILRILKLGNYFKSFDLISDVFKQKKDELLVTVSITGLILLITSTLMYEIENSVQPEQFPNILGTLWWSVATLTTIGYGDVYPITALGKILASITALLGIGIIAIPTGIISSGFIEVLQRRNENKKSKTISENVEKEPRTLFCPHCGEKFTIDDDS